MRALVLGVVVAVAPAAVQGQDRPRLAVVPTQFDKASRAKVPDLFDDYVLTAVHKHASGYDVIGQDDLASIIGFEQQKELLDCGDTSCMASLGGAMGVQKLVSFQIARLQKDWVVTAKVINIEEAKVESRVNHITSGDLRTLLEEVDGVVARLLAYQAEAAANAAPTSQPADDPAPAVAEAEPGSEAPLAEAGAAEGEPASEEVSEPAPPAAESEQVAVAQPAPAVQVESSGGVPVAIPIVLLVAGVGGVVTGGVFGGMALDSERCANEPYEPFGGGCVGGQRASAQASDQSLAANIGLLGGAAVAAAGIVLFFFTGGSDPPPVAPSVAADAAGLVWSGRF